MLSLGYCTKVNIIIINYERTNFYYNSVYSIDMLLSKSKRPYSHVNFELLYQ